MSERYIRVFSLPELLYAEGAPVIIMAGAILKDTQTSSVLAQLKLRSIADKTIKAATVRLSLFDTVNASLGEDINFQYLDLAIKRNQEFGEQIPIPLPLVETRVFSVVVTKVIFTDNTIWNEKGKTWEELPTTIPLEASLKSHELVKQFQMSYGGSCLYQEEKDLWRCVCGCWNRKTDEACYSCRRSAVALSGFDLDKLEAAAEKRIAEEEEAERRAREAKIEAERKARLAKEEQEQKETEERKKRNDATKRFLKKAKMPSIVLIISLVICFVVNSIHQSAETKAELQKFKIAFEAQSSGWDAMNKLTQNFSLYEYEYDTDKKNVKVIFSFLKSGFSQTEAAKYADILSEKMYKHNDNAGKYDCTVFLYDDAFKKHLFYSSCNGEKVEGTSLELSNSNEDFENSSVYSTTRQHIIDSFTSDGYSVNVVYNDETKTVTITCKTSDIENRSSLINSVSHSEWESSVCNPGNEGTTTLCNTYKEAGYSINCVLSFRSNDGKILFTSTNGKTTYNCMDENALGRYDDVIVGFWTSSYMLYDQGKKVRSFNDITSPFMSLGFDGDAHLYVPNLLDVTGTWEETDVSISPSLKDKNIVACYLLKGSDGNLVMYLIDEGDYYNVVVLVSVEGGEDGLMFIFTQQ